MRDFNPQRAMSALQEESIILNDEDEELFMVSDD